MKEPKVYGRAIGSFGQGIDMTLPWLTREMPTGETEACADCTDKPCKAHRKFFDNDLVFGDLFNSDMVGYLKDLYGPFLKVEWKNDREAKRTGNFYAEYESREEPSGLSTTWANLWGFGIDGVCIIVPFAKLHALCRDQYMKSGPVPGGDLDKAGEKTSKGVLIPVDAIKDLI